MNLNQPGSKSTVLILNHLAMSLSFGTLFVDIIKMVFVYDTPHTQKLISNPNILYFNVSTSTVKSLTNVLNSFQ
jgi:hypothetical protein